MKEFIFWLVLALVFFILMSLSGCATTKTPDPFIPGSTEIQTVIKNISWIQGILIIGIVGSIFACFNGAAKIGIPLLISSLVGYGLTSAMLFYAKLIAVMSLIGGVGLCGYMIFIKHQALKQIVTGVENFKKECKQTKTVYIDDVLSGNQKPTTKQLIKKIKEKNGNS